MDRCVTLARSLDMQHAQLMTDKALQAMRQYAVDSAASSIEMGHLERAVEFAEYGRGTILNHVGRYRSPALVELRRVDPELADEFIRLTLSIDIILTENPNEPQETGYEAENRYEDLNAR